MKNIRVTKEHTKKRLDVFLAERLKETRSQTKRLIQSGRVSVNGHVASVHRFLQPEDKVTIESVKNMPVVKAKPFPKKLEPKVIAKTSDYLVINKPSGLLVHPTQRFEPNTLVDWLKKHYPTIIRIGEDPIRPGIVHRLDQDVSGLMVIALSQKMFTHLKKQFQDRLVEKEYTALTYGNPDVHETKIDIPIGRSDSGKFVARSGGRIDNQDKEAQTIFWAEEQIGNYALVKVKILTGRTHQIRAHLSHAGHPVVGDAEYGPRKPFYKKFSRKIKTKDPGRIFLHSTRLAFFTLKNEKVEYTSPLPRTLENFLHTLPKHTHL